MTTEPCPKCEKPRNHISCNCRGEFYPFCHGHADEAPTSAEPHYHTFAGAMDRCERTDCLPPTEEGWALISHRICERCNRPIAKDADYYCAGHGKLPDAEEERATSEPVDLTALIKRARKVYRDPDFAWDSFVLESTAERDEIVEALRVVRVLRHLRVMNVTYDNRFFWVRFIPRDATEGTPGYLLDAAERILFGADSAASKAGPRLNDKEDEG